MKSNSLRWASRIYAAVLIMLIAPSCSVVAMAQATPTVVSTSTPERLKLIDGELDPCLLVHSDEVEIVLGIAVSSEVKLLDYMPSCKYISTSGDQTALLIVSAVTDMSIEKANQPSLKVGNVPISAVEVYERLRMAASRTSEINKFQDLDNLGDKAFLYRTNFLVINILRNNIFYSFSGKTDYGVDYDSLVKLIKIGLERMP